MTIFTMENSSNTLTDAAIAHIYDEKLIQHPCWCKSILYLRLKIHPAILLMQRWSLFTMKNSSSNLADATIDHIYDGKFIQYSCWCNNILYLWWNFYPSPLLMQWWTLFTMKNSFSTIPDAIIDFIYDVKFIQYSFWCNDRLYLQWKIHLALFLMQ
jgi:hypothetical protein